MTSQTAFVTIVAPILLLVIIIAVVWSLRTAGRHPVRAIWVSIICAVIIRTALINLPLLVEDSLNQLTANNSLAQSEKKHIASHFRVADLHSDVLLWAARDFTVTTKHPFISNRVIGHVDLPRLRKGNVVLQVFALLHPKIVNSVPRGINFLNNKRPTALTDAVTLKAVFERWPRNSWFSPKNRVFYASQRLYKAVEQVDDLIIVRKASDLPATDGSKGANTIHSILAVEGLSCLDNNISSIDAFFDAGVRIMGPTHFHDTEVGGSKSGMCRCGLSAFGSKVIRRMKELNIIVDLAHAHPLLVSDITGPPVILSHTGVEAICASERNEDDDTIRRVARAGGLIGVGLFNPPLCGDDWLDTFVKTVHHLRTVTGSSDVIALGSDWDGTVVTVVPSDRTDLLIDVLLTRGNFSYQEVQKIMFLNALRFFQKALPTE